MLNILVFVGEVMLFILFNINVLFEEINEVIVIFISFGEVEVVFENLMDVVIGVSGFLLVYVYMFIEVLVDGVVLSGMFCDKVYKFVV